MRKIGLVQAPSGPDKEENLQTLRRFAMKASEAGCQAICFGECFLTGYLPQQARSLAVSVREAPIQALAETAREFAMDILVGFMECEGDEIYITHGLFRPDGTMDFYRKTHLGERERQVFTPGNRLKVFTMTGGWKAGIALCVETHYPEIAQTLALRGAEVIFAPHAVPRVSGDRQTIWGKYIPARSYDNRIYMACCNLWDPDRFGGGCMVTGPRGEVTGACFRDEPALLVCSLDEELIGSFRSPDSRRSRHFYPALRRPALYEQENL